MKALFNDVVSVVVFTVAFLLALFILPSHILNGPYVYLGLVFIIVFSLNMTCLVKVMRHRANTAKAQGAGIFGIIGTALGFIALQMCGVGGPLCGALFGSVVFASLLPAGSLGYFTHYAVEMVVMAIVIQIISLWYLKCFSLKF